MKYYDVVSIGEEKIIPFITGKYDLAELWTHGEGWVMFETDPDKRKQFMDDYFTEILKGYRTETAIDDEMVAKLPLFVQANRIELLVDAFEVEQSTDENYLDEEDLEQISKCLLEGNVYFSGRKEYENRRF